jgi:hypothetical protein
MTKRKSRKKIGVLPSGHAGVYRADDGKRWEAYVAEKKNLRLLGIYPTIRAAAAARAKYWKAKGSSQPSHLR